MKMFYFLLFFLANSTISAQNFNDNIKLTIELQETDSQFYLVPHLKVFKDTQQIQIKKLIYFGFGDCFDEGTFTLEKLIGNVYVNLSIFSLPQEFENQDLYIYINFTSKDSINYHVNLGHYIPLEPGKYRTLFKIPYLLNGLQVKVYSEYLFFEISHRPKNSSFFKINNK